MKKPKQHHFQTGETDLCYFEWGDASHQTIIMLHATGFHARCWDKVIAHLADDYHVIAVDHRGHGRSGKPKSLSDWSIQAGDVARLIEHLDIKNIIGVGHSMGGNALVQICANHGDYFDRLVLVDPTIMAEQIYQNPEDPKQIDPSVHPVSRRRNEWESAQQMFDHFKNRMPYCLWEEDVLRDYCDYGLLPNDSGDGYQLACPPILEASVYLGFNCVNPYPSVDAINCPVHILRAPGLQAGGEMDFTVSPTWDGLVGRFANAHETYLPDLTHFMPMQAPELVASLIKKDSY